MHSANLEGAAEDIRRVVVDRTVGLEDDPQFPALLSQILHNMRRRQKPASTDAHSRSDPSEHAVTETDDRNHRPLEFEVLVKLV